MNSEAYDPANDSTEDLTEKQWMLRILNRFDQINDALSRIEEEQRLTRVEMDLMWKELRAHRLERRQTIINN